jgi:FixJ family two-component response regulator
MSKAHRTVAIVDDDASMRRGLKRLLKTQKWEVYTYSTAEEFLEREPGIRLDLVLIDLYLPGLNGVELLKRLSAEPAGPAVILMTGHSESETADILAAAGSTSCLRKPFTLTQLLDAILSA